MQLHIKQKTMRLKRYHYYLWFRKLNGRTWCKTSQIMFHIFKNKVQAARCLWRYQALQLYYIWMVKPAQNEDFPCHKLYTLRIKIIKAYPLQGNDLLMSQITCFINSTVSSLANLHDIMPSHESFRKRQRGISSMIKNIRG